MEVGRHGLMFIGAKVGIELEGTAEDLARNTADLANIRAGFDEPVPS